MRRCSRGCASFLAVFYRFWAMLLYIFPIFIGLYLASAEPVLVLESCSKWKPACRHPSLPLPLPVSLSLVIGCRESATRLTYSSGSHQWWGKKKKKNVSSARSHPVSPPNRENVRLHRCCCFCFASFFLSSSSCFLLFSPAASRRTPEVLVLKAEQPLQAESGSDPVILSARTRFGFNLSRLSLNWCVWWEHAGKRLRWIHSLYTFL